MNAQKTEERTKLQLIVTDLAEVINNFRKLVDIIGNRGRITATGEVGVDPYSDEDYTDIPVFPSTSAGQATTEEIYRAIQGLIALKERSDEIKFTQLADKIRVRI